MLNAFRNRLADWLRSEVDAAEAPAVPSRAEPTKKAATARAALVKMEAAKPAKNGDDDLERRAARLERRRRDAEEGQKKAEERAAKADLARKAAEDRARALDLELAQTRERARAAEARAKKAADVRPKKGNRRGGNAPSAPAPTAPVHPPQRDRVAELERALEDAKARTVEARARLAEAESRIARAEARASEAAPRPSLPRRDISRSSLDVHFSPGDECLFAICRHIELTEKTLDACVFTITDDRIATRLLEAHRRGVRVRIITDNDKAHDDGSDVHRLARAGIEVRVDETPFHMHHKFALFDERKVLTGSYNWTRGAARDNQENVVTSDDARLLRPFGREFAKIWEKLSRSIDPG
jgi:phosphatidylserine/phosphatidylglycerophosphate/cardiolipin synthase-like enzyme